MSLLYSYVMSYLRISQWVATWIVAQQLSRWVLLAAILLMIVVLGFLLPPVSINLMTAPIILPPLKAAGFDLIAAGRTQHLRRQEHRAGRPARRRDLEGRALCGPDAACRRVPLLLAQDSEVAAGGGDQGGALNLTTLW